jgi:hypothetical protein
MASTGLLNPNVKMTWAKKHLDSLDRIRKAFIESDPQRISAHDDLQVQEHIVTITVLGAPSDSGLVFGDAVSCMRSALDYLAWQLALLSTEKPSRDICFPVLEKNTLETQLQFTRQTYGISDDAIAVMKSLQPYHAGDDCRLHHLWRLNKLWNVVKHRHIGLHSSVVQVLLPKGIVPIETKMVNNHGIMRFPLSNRPDMSLYPRMPIEIQFGDEREEVITVLSDLEAIYEFIGTVVFPQFEQFFPNNE